MSNAKKLSPGWPDPSDWVRKLRQEMTTLQTAYDAAETDTLEQRYWAGRMVAMVEESLRELPPFNNDGVLYPLKELLIFLADLDKGRDHKWSAPRNFGGTNITTTAQGELKIWVRAVYAVLTANGFKPVDAYRRIADGLTKSGRTGRGRAPVRWQLVQGWCRQSKSPSEQHVSELLDRWWADVRDGRTGIRVVDDRGTPVPVREVAGLFADNSWFLPHLRDRSFSGGSE